MTFTQMQRGVPGGAGGWTCDCDECGIRTNEVIPVAIQQAIHRYKRQKLEQGQLKRTQDRSLVKRHGTAAVWQWLLPHGAEPLVEFGNSHRFIWVKRLPGKLYSIGKGVIGSQAEENMRQVMRWEPGSVYFVPAKVGKAVGWVHKVQEKDNEEEPSSLAVDDSESNKSKPTTAARGGPADLIIAKVPAESMQAPNSTDEKEGDGDEVLWTNTLSELCLKYSNKSVSEEAGFAELSKDDAKRLQVAVQ